MIIYFCIFFFFKPKIAILTKREVSVVICDPSARFRLLDVTMMWQRSLLVLQHGSRVRYLLDTNVNTPLFHVPTRIRVWCRRPSTRSRPCTLAQKSAPCVYFVFCRHWFWGTKCRQPLTYRLDKDMEPSTIDWWLSCWLSCNLFQLILLKQINECNDKNGVSTWFPW